MKIHILIILFSLSLACSPRSQTSSNLKTPASTPIQTEIPRKATKEERVAVLEKSRRDLSDAGIESDLKGEEKEILILKSSSDPASKIANLLRDSLQDYRDIGFTTIVITDKEGEVQKIDLTALDK